jgi:hypothetical protein
LHIVWLPDVGAAGPGCLVDAHQDADLIVGEAGREQITRRVGVGVDDGDDRAAVDLPAIVGLCERSERRRARRLTGGNGAVELSPRIEFVSCGRAGYG